VNFSPKADCSSETKLSVALTAGTTYRVLVEGYYYQGPITLTVAQGAMATQVAAISPSSGSSAGGAPVTIAGSGFAAPATVNIGGIPATNVMVVSPSLITATTPAHPAAMADVSVSSGGSTAMLGNAYTY